MTNAKLISSVFLSAVGASLSEVKSHGNKKEKKTAKKVAADSITGWAVVGSGKKMTAESGSGSVSESSLNTGAQPLPPVKSSKKNALTTNVLYLLGQVKVQCDKTEMVSAKRRQRNMLFSRIY